MTVFGRRVKPGVIGAPAPLGNDFGAMAINSQTGAGRDDGDISPEDTLQAAAATLAAAVGVSRERIGVRVNGGRVVEAAVRSTA